MIQKLLTSSEVAELINVNVSTVKRWTNSGELQCTTTLGGHRKYRLKDIINFARKNNIGFIPAAMFPEKENIKKLNYAIYSGDFEYLSAEYLKYILKGKNGKAEQFLKMVYSSNIPLEIIYDKIITQAMKKVGELWYNEKIGIETEHLCTNITLHSVIKLQEIISRKEPINKTALCGCLNDEMHDLAITLVSNLIESEGWQSYMLGANTPAASFIKAISNYKPDLVCISSTYISDTEQFIMDVNNIFLHANKSGAKLTVSGSSINEEIRKKIKYDYSPDSAADTLEMLNVINKK